MRVIVTAVAAPSGISGVQRHALNLLRCLLHLPEIQSVRLIVAPWQCEMVRNAGMMQDPRLCVEIATTARGSLARNLWHYRELPKLVHRERPSLVHLSYPVPVNASTLRCPTVLTLHDLYPFEIPANFGYPKALLNQMILKQSLRAVSAIACVSEATRAKLQSLFPTAAAKAIIVSNCVELAAGCSLHPPFPGLNHEPFLLCVAQHRRNKNIAVAIRAFGLLLRSGTLPGNSRLVILGMEGPETARLRQLTTELGLAAGVLFLRDLTDAEVLWCYSRCEALLAPSLCEGFGLPVAEARLAGTRVVCSDISSLREIGGDTSGYVSLQGQVDLRFALAIENALKRPAAVPVPLPQYSAATLASHYAALYGEVVGSFNRTASVRSGPVVSLSIRERHTP